jgi:hypothetical protein
LDLEQHGLLPDPLFFLSFRFLGPFPLFFPFSHGFLGVLAQALLLLLATQALFFFLFLAFDCFFPLGPLLH